MSEQEKFLARWSRRKREGGTDKPAPAAKPAVPQEDAAPVDARTAPRAAHGGEQSQPAVDLSELPSLDSITGETDIRGFLKPGVPAELSRAALRRAWSTDPAIRDFVGLSENSWDFNNDEMQGFGPLDPSDNLRKLLAQATGRPEPVDEAPPQSAADASDDTGHTADELTDLRGEQDQPVESAPTTVAESSQTERSENEILQSHNSDIAMQQDKSDRLVPRRRKSGGALPT